MGPLPGELGLKHFPGQSLKRQETQGNSFGKRGGKFLPKGAGSPNPGGSSGSPPGGFFPNEGAFSPKFFIPWGQLFSPYFFPDIFGTGGPQRAWSAEKRGSPKGGVHLFPPACHFVAAAGVLQGRATSFSPTFSHTFNKVFHPPQRISSSGGPGGKTRVSPTIISRCKRAPIFYVHRCRGDI